MKRINNKGFTLIELISIIVVLVAIFLVSFPNLLSVTKDEDEKLYSDMIDDLCLAGETYVYSHMDQYPELSTIGESFYVPISKLMEYGSVSKDRENPKTGELIKNNSVKFTVLEDNSLKCEYSDNVYLNSYITNLYTPNDTVVNNSITYNVDTTNGIIDDGLGGTVSSGGNLRYYGASPNNYIDIGDRDSDGNVILWRIIGVFETKYATEELSCDTDSDSDGHYDNCASDKLVKIIRYESLGKYSWDNKTSGIGSSTSSYGSNDWTDARLMMLLNPGYENPSDTSIYEYEGSLYWNSKSGKCYSRSSGATVDCDFTSTGLSTEAQSKVENVLWNLGGLSSSSSDANYYRNLYSEGYYKWERGTTVYSGRPTEWVGKIGLMYPSDYGYATDLGSCSQTLSSYNNSSSSYACRTNDWLYDSTENQWTLSPESAYAYRVFNVLSPGYVDTNYANNTYDGVRPVLYLKSDTVLTGTGMTSDGITYYTVE